MLNKKLLMILIIFASLLGCGFKRDEKLAIDNILYSYGKFIIENNKCIYRPIRISRLRSDTLFSYSEEDGYYFYKLKNDQVEYINKLLKKIGFRNIHSNNLGITDTLSHYLVLENKGYKKFIYFGNPKGYNKNILALTRMLEIHNKKYLPVQKMSAELIDNELNIPIKYFKKILPPVVILPTEYVDEEYVPEKK